MRQRAVVSPQLVGVLVALILLSVVALLSAPRIEAESTTSYTSTADFDGGVKVVPGAEYFTENGVDQPFYSPISQPSAIYALGKTYVVYQGDVNFAPYIVAYDHAVGTWSTPIRVSGNNPVAGDGHGAPSMLLDSQGRFHVFFGAHNNALQYSRSSFSYNVAVWTAETSPVAIATYPTAVEYQGAIWLFYRGGSLDWFYKKSTDWGNTWGAETTWITLPGNDGPYVYTKSALSNRLYFTWTKHIDASNSRKHVYACYMDLDTGDNFSMSGGTNLGASIDATEGDASCRLRNSGAQIVWNTIMRPRATNDVYLFYNEGNLTAGTWYTNFTRWDGSSWTSTQSLFTTDTANQYGDLIVTSATDAEALLVRSGFLQLTGGDDYSGDIERWTWNGSTWTSAGFVLQQKRSGRPVSHATPVRGGQSDLRFVFDQFGSNEGQYNLKLYGWGSGGLIGSALPSDTRGVQTETDNPSIAAGAFELANAKRDSFAFTVADADTRFWNFLQGGDATGQACTKSFTGSVFSIYWEGSDTGRRSCMVRGNFGITGDFDVRVRFDITDGTSTPATFRQALCVYDQMGWCARAIDTNNLGDDGVAIEYIDPAVSPPPAGIFRSYSVTAGSVAQIGTDTDATCDPCYLRIARSTATFTTYFSTDGSSWTTDESIVKAGLTGTVYVHFGAYANGVASGSVASEFDDWQLAAGAIDSDGWRTSGSWRTPQLTVGYPINVTVTYSGVSVSRYVDRVAIIGPDGVVLQSDGTDRTSGTSATSTFTWQEEMRSGWSVDILLAGDGSGSPSATQVDVETAAAPPPPTGGGPPPEEPPPTGLPFPPIGAPVKNLLDLVGGVWLLLLIAAVGVTAIVVVRMKRNGGAP